MELFLWLGVFGCIMFILLVIGMAAAAAGKRRRIAKQTGTSAWQGQHNYLRRCTEHDLHGQVCTKPLGHYGNHRWSTPPEERR